MKSIKKILLVVLFVFLLSGCGKNNLKELSFSEFKTKLNNKDTFFVEIVQDGCSHCHNFTPVLKEVLNEYDVVGYQLNMSNLSEEEMEEFDSMYTVTGTPTTIFIKNGVETSIMSRINGEVTKDKIISKLKQNEYIK